MRRMGYGLRIGALWLFAAAPAAALQVLEADDHAELAAEVSSIAVNRIALQGDRIARAVQSGGAFTLEHDPVRGDLYLYPAGGGEAAGPGAAGARAPVTLYVGTERGFTYRLSLRPVARESAQIVIRNRAVLRTATDGGGTAGRGANESRGQALAALILAVVTGRALPGYAIAPSGGEADIAPAEREPDVKVTPVEVWRGARFTARVLAVRDGAAPDARALAELYGRGVLAAWLGPAHGPADGSPAGGSRVDGDPGEKSPAGNEASEIIESGGRSGDNRAAGTRLGVIVQHNVPSELAR